MEAGGLKKKKGELWRSLIDDHKINFQRNRTLLILYPPFRPIPSDPSIGAVYFYNQDKNGDWYDPGIENFSNPIRGNGNNYGTAVAIGETAFLVGVPNENSQSGKVIAYSYIPAASASASASNGSSSSDRNSSNTTSKSADPLPPTPSNSPIAATLLPGQSARDPTATPTEVSEVTSAPTELTSEEQEVTELEISDDCTLAYRVNGWDALTITMELTCEGVEEWVGIGFSTDGFMQNSEAVLGIPGNNQPIKYSLNGKSADAVVQMPEHKQTLINASLEVDNDGRTLMKFTKIMKEEGGIEIKHGGEIFLLYARGMSTNLGYHAERSSVKLTL